MRRDEIRELCTTMQATVIAALEQVDGGASFCTDTWQRSDTGGGHGGGGITRVIRGGKIFEKGGVNFSEVQGTLPEAMSQKLLGRHERLPFSALGTSLVIHPFSPLVPTVHANIRYLEVADRCWFGGGTDLTPYYLYDEDALHFHMTLKQLCERHGPDLYPRFKGDCDRYFYLPHRGESRGIGGIFFDYLGKDSSADLAVGFGLFSELAKHFNDCYVPIVTRRKDLKFTESQKQFQLLRRGRYVEFNLLYDRGTQFGLSTGGRAESILMSLPPKVEWDYDVQVTPGSEEARLVGVLQRPVDWVSLSNS